MPSERIEIWSACYRLPMDGSQAIFADIKLETESGLALEGHALLYPIEKPSRPGGLAPNPSKEIDHALGND